MARSNGTNAAKAQKLQRQQAALELRRAGKGYTDIGNALGISKSQAHRLVVQGLTETIQHIGAEAQLLKAEEISRLDGLMGTVWTKAKNGDLMAIDRVLKIMERRAKLLGLDAPLKLAGDRNSDPIQHEDVTDPEKMHKYSDAELLRILQATEPKHQ